MKRLPAFLTGLIGLTVGGGFYWVLCAFLVIASFANAPHLPNPRERAFMVGAGVFHAIPLILWIALCRSLYRLRLWVFWTLAFCCWLLMPISAAIMIINLGL